MTPQEQLNHLTQMARNQQRALLDINKELEGEATGLLLEADAPEELSVDQLAKLLSRLKAQLEHHGRWAERNLPAQLGQGENLRLVMRYHSDLTERAGRALERLQNEELPVRQRLNRVLQLAERIRVDLNAMDVRTTQAPPSPPSSRPSRSHKPPRLSAQA